MKTKFFILSFLFLIGVSSFSQNNPSVETSLTSIQAGILGIHINNEYKLSDKMVLASEIGLNASVFGGFSYDKTGVVLSPTITIEPKWYYNLQKRMQRDKKYSDNNGNYLSLKTSYTPDWFVISNYEISKLYHNLQLFLRGDLNAISLKNGYMKLVAE